MNRLTKWEDNTTASINGSSPIDKDISQAINRLAEYEDLEEQGLLIRLPCKVGSKIYEVFSYPEYHIEETVVEKIILTGKGMKLKLARNSFYETTISSLGKSIFFTREEAEKRVKELKA